MKFAVAPLTVLMLLATWPAILSAEDVAESLRKLDGRVLHEEESLRDMVPRELSAGIRAANERSTAAWRAIKSRADWEAHRDKCLTALRASLGTFPDSAFQVRTERRGEHRGEGYVVLNITYESRPGLLVTANLYLPDPPREHSPGIVISHSHHAPKTQGELQDMGILWARAGCLVLVPDHLGHGERRQHPFAAAEDYSEKFQVGRQDYYFRYNVGLQLYAAGETLLGWMANDLLRGVDVLLQQKSIDREKIILLGAVAGGGDPAAVAAALDNRFAAVVPFNFGGPQPETKYPLPDDADTQFNYAGSGSWESTRNLYRSADEGFLPWVIVGSVAPRRVIHAHEFAWDDARDPVWNRYQKIFGFYEAHQNLASTHGYGRVTLPSSEASHCNNIGRVHRQAIHTAFRGWFGIEVDEERPHERHRPEELHCFASAEEASKMLTPARELAGSFATAASEKFEQALATMPPAAKRKTLQDAWAARLGPIEPYAIEKEEDRGITEQGELRLERRLLQGPGEIRLPLLLLSRKGRPHGSIVVMVAQQGKAALLKERAEAIAKVLEEHAVCLVDLRGMGESRADVDRGRRSHDTSLAATSLMLGQTSVGQRLCDVRAVLSYLRSREDFSKSQLLLYGDSLSVPNQPEDRLVRPLDVAQPRLAEPLGAMLVVLTALYEPNVRVLGARGGLTQGGLNSSPAVHVPLDGIIPGALTIGDIGFLEQVLANQVSPAAIEGHVNGLNVFCPK